MIVYEQAQLCRTTWLAPLLCLENWALACLETIPHGRLWLRVPGLLSFDGAAALANLFLIADLSQIMLHTCTAGAPFLFSILSTMPMKTGMQERMTTRLNSQGGRPKKHGPSSRCELRRYWPGELFIDQGWARGTEFLEVESADGTSRWQALPPVGTSQVIPRHLLEAVPEVLEGGGQ